MTEDATLDAFAEADDAASADEEGGETTVADSDHGDSSPVRPLPTSTWRQGGECASCGASAARRFRDGGEQVCGDCASWTAGGANGDGDTN